MILDTGPLVSALVPGSAHHAWVARRWKTIAPPFLTCESVLSEAVFLLCREGVKSDVIFTLLERGVVRLGLQVRDELPEVRALMHKYRDRPMSLADACLVRLSELHPSAEVLTFDGDFLIYRRHGNGVIPVVMPPAM